MLARITPPPIVTRCCCCCCTRTKATRARAVSRDLIARRVGPGGSGAHSVRTRTAVRARTLLPQEITTIVLLLIFLDGRRAGVFRRIFLYSRRGFPEIEFTPCRARYMTVTFPKSGAVPVGHQRTAAIILLVVRRCSGKVPARITADPYC